MKYFIVFLLISISACHSDSKYVEITIIANLQEANFGQWYRVQKQFLYSKVCDEHFYASAYLCTRENYDTV